MYKKLHHTVLITSAAYLEPDLEVEFGKIPPCFLPLGNRRLFIWQLESLRRFTDRIILSLPEDFHLDKCDELLLSELDIETLFIPVGLSLGNSVVTAMNMSGATADGVFSILHGDTLMTGIDFTVPDALSVCASPPPGYKWGWAELADGNVIPVDPPFDTSTVFKKKVLTGWFSFSRPVQLVQGIVRNGGNFLQGIADYGTCIPLRELTSDQWFDFGHSGTFYTSRRSMSRAREFNRLNFEERVVIKSGDKPNKIEAEAQWFERLPSMMRLYTPAYLGRSVDHDASYTIEYLNLPTLSDIFVFGRLSTQSWDHIFSACDEFLSSCKEWPVPEPNKVAAVAQSLYLEKTMLRLNEFSRLAGVDLKKPCRLNGVLLPSLEKIAYTVSQAIPEPGLDQLSLVHGDFCFSNILYDQRSHRIRVIDPRGHDANGSLSLYGDIRYDIGKLHHSVVGRYDHIIAGFYQIEQNGETDFNFSIPEGDDLKLVSELFLNYNFASFATCQTAPAISVLLFLSMLPLHFDDKKRQMALLANALRLFSAVE